MNDDDRESIKAFFLAERGYWRPWTETMLRVCPEFVQQYARYAGHPARTGPLTPRMVELIYVALDASASHLYEPGLQTHMKRAREVGASDADIFDVLHLVAVQGAASVGQAADLLAEMCEAPDPNSVDEELQSRVHDVGRAHAIDLQSIARMDPGYAEVLLDFVEHGRPSEGLAPSERSVIQVALHACFTAFNPAAVKSMLSTALSQGVTPAELLQAIQLGAHLASHGTALGANVFQALAHLDNP